MQLDFSTLERMSGGYVSDDLRDRENVISPKANPYQQEKHNGGVPFMANSGQYEEQIFKELRALPKEALPKILRIIALVREEFLTKEKQELQKGVREKTNHGKTRQLLATSKSNWAQELIVEREDRL